jgi:hypothetical protein
MNPLALADDLQFKAKLRLNIAWWKAKQKFEKPDESQVPFLLLSHPRLVKQKPSPLALFSTKSLTPLIFFCKSRSFLPLPQFAAVQQQRVGASVSGQPSSNFSGSRI